MIPILFLAADPTDTSRLRLGEEIREIQEKLQLAKSRDEFVLHQRLSVRPTDVSQALLDLNPRIVHFSGHGGTTGALYIEDLLGKKHPIEPEALASLFEQFANQVGCVILNACYSEIQAQAIARHIEYVIGMNQAIGDKAAIAFSVGFYQALGAGRSIEEAYKLGCAQIRLQGITEHPTPVLIKKKQPTTSDKSNPVSASAAAKDDTTSASILSHRQIALKWAKAGRKESLCDLNLSGEYLAKIDLAGADLSRSNLSGADLRRANFRKADLGVADLSGTDLRWADLREADLGMADLRGANLSKASLTNASLIAANLSKADLSAANLEQADLSAGILEAAILFKTDLRGAIIREANLHGTNLRGAILDGADLRGAILDGANLRGADYSDATMWPQGFDPRKEVLSFRKKSRIFGAKASQEDE